MTDSNQQRAVTAAFAPPPPLWKHFTRENLDKLDQIKAEAVKDREGLSEKDKKWLPAELRKLDLPPELRFMVPPEIPTGEYSVFGELQTLSTTLPSLKEQGIDQLYPEPTDTAQAPSTSPQGINHAYYLLKISKSLLLNFLEFVGILSISPEQFESKVQDLRNLFINAHHLLNLYRPHQARESLIVMMEEQLERTKNEIQQMDKVKVDIEDLLSRLETEGRQMNSTKLPEMSGQLKEVEERVNDSQLIWNLLDKEELLSHS
ncbi:hypothetical protein N7462_011044 [Penicillium macrosclerotiorum]|uniref:uncharacterized protein n=1 Tax=Penicillium macrosclerotiorum TaxID=303699 RepID=UPI00254850A6|nr:uncharacterized protein N7462_011044 [Penicillium macrosclerotiorum]KAJ5666635.1 hypothetical protein N7462_011044 [Penicillium macrosclerotiorum]